MATIAQIATENGNFQTLLQLATFVDASLPGTNLVATLSDETQDLTVFAPTDDAFLALAEALGFSDFVFTPGAIGTFLENGLGAEVIRDVILYHVSPGAKSAALIGGFDTLPTALSGATIAPEGLRLGDNEPDVLDPEIIQGDIGADNGVVHVINRVLLPVDLPGNDAPTIGSFLESDSVGDFQILSLAVEFTGLDAVLQNEAVDLTVFAPGDGAFRFLASDLGMTDAITASTDDVFDYLLEALTLLSGGAFPNALFTDILLYHVIGDDLQFASQVDNQTLMTLAEEPVIIENGIVIDQEPDNISALVFARDLLFSNGIVHEIDEVLLPLDILQSNGTDDVDFVIDGNANTVIRTGGDNDLIDGNGGVDDIRAGNGNDLVLGGRGADLIFGNKGSDVLRGEGGKDQITGGRGNDLIDGGGGDDRLLGGRGKDTIDGGTGDDTILAGVKDDTIIGNWGDDDIRTGTGADVVIFREGDGKDILRDFDVFEDTLDLSAFGFADFEDFSRSSRIDEFTDSVVLSFGDDSLTFTNFSFDGAFFLPSPDFIIV
ncbi:MAG: fasciclin domain-containing protein [Pseudomonadota bacterium]